MKRIVYSFWMGALILLSSCTRFIHWTYHTFHEPEYIAVDLTPARAHLCTIRAYHQFNTIALFDVLWLCDAVRMVYAELYVCKRCKTLEQKELIMERQLQENNHFITFYVLMPEKDGIAFGSQLGKWSCALEINGVIYSPCKVKIIDELAYEWRTIFDDRYTPFKTTYEVQFAAHDLEGNPLITPATDVITLCVSSTQFREYCTFYPKPPLVVAHHDHNRPI